MHQRQAAHGAFVGEVGIEGGQLLGQHQALVDDRKGGAGADEEVVEVRLLRRALADGIEHGLEGFLGAVASDEELPERGHGFPGRGTQGIDIDWRNAPAEDGLAVMHHGGFQDCLMFAAGGGILGEEAHGYGVVARRR